MHDKFPCVCKYAQIRAKTTFFVAILVICPRTAFFCRKLANTRSTKELKAFLHSQKTCQLLPPCCIIRPAMRYHTEVHLLNEEITDVLLRVLLNQNELSFGETRPPPTLFLQCTKCTKYISISNKKGIVKRTPRYKCHVEVKQIRQWSSHTWSVAPSRC